VEALAVESWRESGIAHWMSDIMTTAFAKVIGMDKLPSLRTVQAADFLEGEQILDRVRQHGWVTAARRSYISDMAFALERAQRVMGGRPQPAGPSQISLDDPTGVHRFGRA
jgi:hypothetical protein